MSIAPLIQHIRHTTASLRADNDRAELRELQSARQALQQEQRETVDAQIALIGLLQPDALQQGRRQRLAELATQQRQALARLAERISLLQQRLTPARPLHPVASASLSTLMGYGSSRYQGD